MTIAYTYPIFILKINNIYLPCYFYYILGEYIYIQLLQNTTRKLSNTNKNINGNNTNVKLQYHLPIKYYFAISLGIHKWKMSVGDYRSNEEMRKNNVLLS
jgi:hypothetical protein